MRKNHGFTMVELLVGMAIIGILTAIAVPSMRGAIENSRIRAVGETMQNGLALARADAVRLNTRVAFVVSATGWTVQRTDDATVLHRATGKEATTGLTVTYTPADATTVTFDAFGRVVAPNPDGTASITNMALASATPSGLASYKPLQIQLTATGMSRLCDPYAGSTEPRACL